MKPKDWWKNMVIKDKEQNKKEFLATFCASRKSGQTKALQWVITDEMLFHEVVGFVVFDSPPRHQLSLGENWTSASEDMPAFRQHQRP